MIISETISFHSSTSGARPPPEPGLSFNLKMIGIGNEDLISTDFEQRYLMICKAVKQKYPQIEVVGTVGPFHFPVFRLY